LKLAGWLNAEPIIYGLDAHEQTSPGGVNSRCLWSFSAKVARHANRDSNQSERFQIVKDRRYPEMTSDWPVHIPARPPQKLTFPSTTFAT
jgi:hypothetical protein